MPLFITAMIPESTPKETSLGVDLYAKTMLVQAEKRLDGGAKFPSSLMILSQLSDLTPKSHFACNEGHEFKITKKQTKKKPSPVIRQ